MPLPERCRALTPKMLDALHLLIQHGDGDVSHDKPTALVHGTPCVNLKTAMALDRLGLVSVFEQSHWELWGSIELLETGRLAVAHGEARAAQADYRDRYGRDPDLSEFC